MYIALYYHLFTRIYTVKTAVCSIAAPLASVSQRCGASASLPSLGSQYGDEIYRMEVRRYARYYGCVQVLRTRRVYGRLKRAGSEAQMASNKAR